MSEVPLDVPDSSESSQRLAALIVSNKVKSLITYDYVSGIVPKTLLNIAAEMADRWGRMVLSYLGVEKGGRRVATHRE